MRAITQKPSEVIDISTWPPDSEFDPYPKGARAKSALFSPQGSMGMGSDLIIEMLTHTPLSDNLSACMPRKPRIEYAGAFYHVITRGNQKQSIFKDTADFQKYLQLLTIYKNRTNCRIFAYVLMNNHVHLLIETQDVPLSNLNN